MSENEEEILTCIEIDPPVPAKRSVIVLHGLGADGSDFVPIVPELNLPESAAVRFVFPHAPVMPITINNGFQMRAWYDITSFAIDKNIDKENMAKSANLVEKLIEKEVERGISTANIMLAGFSQGAVIALITGLCYPDSLAGIIALSGYLPYPVETLENASDANRQIPIFMAHGTFDPIVPFALGKAASMFLKDANYPITWHNYPIPHSVSPDEIKDIASFIKEVWR